MTVNNVQVGGNHYKGSGYEHWDFVNECLHGRYLEGCVTKYITRHRKKNGLLDLRKALHYLDKIRELHQKRVYMPIGFAPRRNIEQGRSVGAFCTLNEMPELETSIVARISTWENEDDLGFVRNQLLHLIALEEEAARQLEARKAGAHTPQTTPLTGAVDFLHHPAPPLGVVPAEEPGRGYVDQG